MLEAVVRDVEGTQGSPVVSAHYSSLAGLEAPCLVIGVLLDAWSGELLREELNRRSRDRMRWRVDSVKGLSTQRIRQVWLDDAITRAAGDVPAIDGELLQIEEILF